MPWGTDRVERPPRDPTLMEIETSPEKRVKKWKPKKHKPKSSPRPEDLDEIDSGLVKAQVMGVQSQRYVIQPALKDQIERTAEAARAAKAELERRQQLAIHIQAAERRRQAVYQRKSAEAEKLSAVLVARQREEARQQQQQQGEGVLNAIGNLIMAWRSLRARWRSRCGAALAGAAAALCGWYARRPLNAAEDMPLLNTDKARNQTAAVERAKIAENAATGLDRGGAGRGGGAGGGEGGGGQVAPGVVRELCRRAEHGGARACGEGGDLARQGEGE